MEHHTGLQQHGGCKYDQAIAERWAELLNAFYQAWGLEKHDTGGSTHGNSNRKTNHD